MQRKTDLMLFGLLIGCAMPVVITAGLAAALGLLYGGMIVVAISRLQQWQQIRAAALVGNDPAKNLRYLYRCAAERFVVTVLCFAVGLGLMEFHPLALLGGYAIAQMVVAYSFYQVSNLRRRHG